MCCCARRGTRRVCRYPPQPRRLGSRVISLRVALQCQGPPIVSLLAVKGGVFGGVTHALFQPRDAHGSLSFLLFPPSTETCRRARVTPPLFIGALGSSLGLNWNLARRPVLALDGHELDTALAGRSHGNHAGAVAINRGRALADIVHWNAPGAVVWLHGVAVVLGRGYGS
jgi:hypothetical protein